MKITIYRSKKSGQWHIRFKSRNGRILLDAGGYNNAANARKTLTSVMHAIMSGSFKIV